MITINLPWPDARLSPNRKNGKAWQSVKGVKDKAWDDAYTLTQQAIRRPNLDWPALGDGDIPLRITFHSPDKRRRDLDNLLASLKPALDAVACALTVDDRQFCPITVARGDWSAGGNVVVEVG